MEAILKKSFSGSRAVLRASLVRNFSSCSKSLNKFQDEYELPKFLPDAHKEFGIDVPKNYVPPQYRDPYKKYDDRQNRVNFGEKIHPFHDYMDMWSPDHFHSVKDSEAVRQISILFGSFVLFGAIIYYTDIWPDRPSVPREYPYEGLYKDLGGREGEQKLYQARPEK